METPKEKNTTGLPQNVTLTDEKEISENVSIFEGVKAIYMPDKEPPHDPDQHTSPLKEVLVDDTQKLQIIDWKEGTKFDNIKFHSIQNDCYVFEKGGLLIGSKKQTSITKALQKISYGNDSINIECIGDDKFLITKN